MATLSLNPRREKGGGGGLASTTGIGPTLPSFATAGPQPGPPPPTRPEPPTTPTTPIDISGLDFFGGINVNVGGGIYDPWANVVPTGTTPDIGVEPGGGGGPFEPGAGNVLVPPPSTYQGTEFDDWIADTSFENLSSLLGEDVDLLTMSREELASRFGFASGAGEFFTPVNRSLIEGAIADVERRRTFGLGQATETAKFERAGADVAAGAQRETGQAELLQIKLQQQQRGKGFGAGGPADRLQRAATGAVTERFGRQQTATQLRREDIKRGAAATRFGVEDVAGREFEDILGDVSAQIADIYGTANELRLSDFATAGGTPFVPTGAPENPAVGDEFTRSYGITYAWNGSSWSGVHTD